MDRETASAMVLQLSPLVIARDSQWANHRLPPPLFGVAAIGLPTRGMRTSTAKLQIRGAVAPNTKVPTFDANMLIELKLLSVRCHAQSLIATENASTRYSRALFSVKAGRRRYDLTNNVE